MLEVILLIYLCSKISKLAESKKLPKGRWVWRTVMYWIVGEIAGVFIVISTGIKISAETVDSTNLFYALAAGILGGFLGYLLVKKQLEDYPSDSTNT